MHYTVQQLLAVPFLTPARRRAALQRMSARAAARKDCASLAGPIDKATAVQERALALADRWRKAEKDHSMHADGAKEMDATVDRAVTAFFTTLEGIARSFDTAEAKVARKLLEEVFPEGATKLVHLPYVEQHAALDAILHRLKTTDLGDGIKALHLEAWVQRIADLNAEYGRLLTRPERLGWDEVSAADTAGYVALAEVVARVIALFQTNDAADVAARAELLEPMVDQKEELAQLRASRKQSSSPEAADDALEGDDTPETEPEATTEAPAAEASPEEKPAA